jgi:hypothetical protein
VFQQKALKGIGVATEAGTWIEAWFYGVNTQASSLAGKLQSRSKSALLRSGIGICARNLGTAGFPVAARARLGRNVAAATKDRFGGLCLFSPSGKLAGISATMRLPSGERPTVRSFEKSSRPLRDHIGQLPPLLSEE